MAQQRITRQRPRRRRAATVPVALVRDAGGGGADTAEVEALLAAIDAALASPPGEGAAGPPGEGAAGPPGDGAAGRRDAAPAA